MVKTILVIDDDAGVRAIIQVILKLEGFDTMTAENGRVGLQLVKHQIPDLIICDLTMPELDGYGVLRVLRQDPITFDIPFIFLTANADKASHRRGMELGANGYLTKPFMPAELLETIFTYLAD